MVTNVGLRLKLIVVTAVAIAIAPRRRFMLHLDQPDAQLRTGDATLSTRTDLLTEVVALAARLGGRSESATRFTTLEQSGQMWRTSRHTWRGRIL